MTDIGNVQSLLKDTHTHTPFKGDGLYLPVATEN